MTTIIGKQTSMTINGEYVGDILSNYVSNMGWKSLEGSGGNSFSFEFQCSDTVHLPVSILVSYDRWFAPRTTVHNAVIDNAVLSDSEFEVLFSAHNVAVSFVRWWHRPIWWMYKKLKRLLSRTGV